MRVLIAILLAATGCSAQPRSEVGEINGASFRISVPEKWNGGLVMYCHGYTPTPGKFSGALLDPVLNVFLEQGYAVAQSGYAGGGWAIQEAIQDTQALQRYFGRKYGAPKETYVTGHSMGGFLTMALLEAFPNSYDGGLALCGPLAPASWFMRRKVFDVRVVFDYYFPGALPPPDKVPAEFTRSPELQQRILALLESMPAQAEAMRRFTRNHTNQDLAGTLVFFTYILKDLQQRGGGNPFDNRNTIYEGTGDDNAVNDGVKRYTSDPRAVEYLRTWYTPTGRLARPMLALHTTYDPLVPPEVPDQYDVISEQAGSAGFFVQQYVKRDGHCAILPGEVARGFADLRAWKSRGERPPAGLRK